MYTRKIAIMITIKRADWTHDVAALSSIRKAVFIEEQHVPVDLEWDGEDDTAWHWLAFNSDNEPVGTIRLLPSRQIGRMAVLQNYRNKGIGKQLLNAAVEQAKQNDWFDVFLHAQSHAIEFYAKADFIAEGPEFIDAGIPHRTMRKALQAFRRLGKDHGKIKLANLSEGILQFATQARRDLMILSYDLNKDYFDNDALADALSRLARSHPSASIRVLLINNQLLSRSSHRLLNLYHRLPSSIQFRVLADENIELIREGWVVADRAGVLGFPIDGNGTSWSDFNNRPLANDYIELFNRYWHTATEDPSLRSIIL